MIGEVNPGFVDSVPSSNMALTSPSACNPICRSKYAKINHIALYISRAHVPDVVRTPRLPLGGFHGLDKVESRKPLAAVVTQFRGSFEVNIAVFWQLEGPCFPRHSHSPISLLRLHPLYPYPQPLYVYKSTKACLISSSTGKRHGPRPATDRLPRIILDQVSPFRSFVTLFCRAVSAQIQRRGKRANSNRSFSILLRRCLQRGSSLPP